MTTMYRQGDVLLVKIDREPDFERERYDYDRKKYALVPLDQGRIVLAYGEVTGHAHAIADVVQEYENGVRFTKARLWDAGAERFLQVMEKVALTHEEHEAIEIPKGTYLVVRQREYDPEQDRFVAD
jgi:hypothetical protein